MQRSTSVSPRHASRATRPARAECELVPLTRCLRCRDLGHRAALCPGVHGGPTIRVSFGRTRCLAARRLSLRSPISWTSHGGPCHSAAAAAAALSLPPCWMYGPTLDRQACSPSRAGERRAAWPGALCAPCVFAHSRLLAVWLRASPWVRSSASPWFSQPPRGVHPPLQPPISSRPGPACQLHLSPAASVLATQLRELRQTPSSPSSAEVVGQACVIQSSSRVIQVVFPCPRRLFEHRDDVAPYGPDTTVARSRRACDPCTDWMSNTSELPRNPNNCMQAIINPSPRWSAKHSSDGLNIER